MIFGLALYGVFHGHEGRGRDFRHCYPNIQRTIVDPLRRLGHTVKVYTCTYPIQDQLAMETFRTMVNPEKAVWCEFAGSTQYTTKTRLFESFADAVDLDVVIFSRCDIHYTTAIDELPLELEKFNFLFREKNHWHTVQYATDNFYVWPHRMTPVVRDAMAATIAKARSIGRVDTHGLYRILRDYVGDNSIHFVSDIHALSNVNVFYSLCRRGLPDRPCLHPEVRERWKDDLLPDLDH